MIQPRRTKILDNIIANFQPQSESNCILVCCYKCYLFTKEGDIIRKTWKGRKQTKMEGGQSGIYLRQARASCGPRVSVAKTYRGETK